MAEVVFERLCKLASASKDNPAQIEPIWDDGRERGDLA